MKKQTKRVLGVGATLGLSAMLLAGCGSDKETEQATDTSKTNENASIKLWVDAAQVETYQGIVDDFQKENPNWKVTIKPSESATAQENIKKDPSAAADVFMFPHDHIGQMVEAGMIYPNTKYEETVKENNIESAVDAATYDGKLYGYPYGVETQILYYNKAKLRAEDVTSWNTLTAKGKLGTNFGEAGANYIFTPLFMSNGNVLYGENGEDLKGTNFNNDKGVQVLEWIRAQKDNKGVIQSNAEALSNLESGKVDAFLSGPWSKNDVEKALGDNFAAAPYPTVDFGDGEVQQKAFLGVKLFGVNAATKSPVAAMALADYITNKESQLTVFEGHGTVPSNIEAQTAENVQADEVTQAVMTMSDAEHSFVMPKLPAMVTFWGPSDAVINDTFNDKISADDYKAKLDKLVEDTSK
ncbi:extracellular solute-binding protein [Vagococcus xieshaowenii]|uniref:Extracellular solute-binding protein n=1 Tax=Vagococcus xieshaowenii TaxID=2562451 RepID=A0AAJ5EEA2_9ENTE|nr:extracellular solute-binding protein [Vagococcus xieshaowenii]QCA28120.1 extracellular solute-binding protein [Vagococcus xieshaowenii]TFZ40163.1 extracellular solute-binding protein [Vagococcus xieshaowenii]